MMLGKSLSRSQWLALFLLFVGVSVIQVSGACNLSQTFNIQTGERAKDFETVFNFSRFVFLPVISINNMEGIL